VASRKKPAPEAEPPSEPEVLEQDEDEEDEDEDGDVIELSSDDGGDTYGSPPAGSSYRAAWSSSGGVLPSGGTFGASEGSSPSLPAVRGSAGVARTAPLQTFMRQIGRFPVLSAEEEHALAVRVFEHADREAAHKLAVHNLRLVVKMAYRYRRAWAQILDLIQEGNVGLVEAVRRFDPYKGARFSTYAAYWIRAYMLRFLLDHSRMVRISRTRAGRKMFFRLNREREKLRSLGIEPRTKLLAEKLGVSEADFEEVSKYMDQSEVRLDAPLSADGDGGGSILDTIRGEQESPESAAHKKALQDDLESVLGAFAATLRDDRERAIWAEHLMTEEPVSLSELGERFGVTKQRMGQIVNAIRDRLKVYLKDKLGPDVELGFTIRQE